MIRFLPRPMRLSPLGMMTRTRVRVIRKGGDADKKNPESGSKSGGSRGLRVLFGGGDPERRERVLAQWRATRRVDSGKGKKKKGAAAVAAAGGGAALATEFDVSAQMVRRVHRDLKSAPPLASG